MTKTMKTRTVELVVGPSGEKLTKDDLPPSSTTRWVARRKAQVVAAVEGGLLTASEACSRYHMTLEELGNWCRDYRTGGVTGLRVVKAQGPKAEAKRAGRPSAPSGELKQPGYWDLQL